MPGLACSRITAAAVKALFVRFKQGKNYYQNAMLVGCTQPECDGRLQLQ